MFPVALAYRQRVEELINGKHTLAEARELYVHAAYLSRRLSDLADDLGATLTAQAFAIDLSGACRAGRPRRVVRVGGEREGRRAPPEWSGQRGDQGRAQRADSFVPRAVLGRAPARRRGLWYARQGNRTACVDLLTQARQVCEQLPDQMPSRLSTASAEHTS